MQATDIRLVEIQERYNVGQGGIIGVIGMVVGASALIAIGYYVTVKFFNKVDQSDFTATQNTTFDSLKTETDDLFDLTTLLVWVTIAAAILSMILGAFMVLGN